ncbi:hypothetical protein JXQ31_18755 [candidate division KSB1 bacterium]|nr:hypothetical protein [candidate division KSB1 bacterium]
MRLSAPKKFTWWASLILAILGLVGSLVVIPGISPIAFFLVLVAYIILFLGTILKGF